MLAMSNELGGVSAMIRLSISSKPLCLGDRTLPGIASIGTALQWAIRIRFPGSPGMPKC